MIIIIQAGNVEVRVFVCLRCCCCNMCGRCQATKQNSTTQSSRSAELPKLHLHSDEACCSRQIPCGLKFGISKFNAHIQIKPRWVLFPKKKLAPFLVN